MAWLWQIPVLSKSLGDDLGVMVAPYQDEDRSVLVSTPGSGYAVMSYSSHIEQAQKFQAFILSDKGQKIIAATGQPATREGFDTDDARINQLSELAHTKSTEVYPMFDNFSQPAVTDSLNKNLPQVLVGRMSPADALSATDAAMASTPKDSQSK